MTTKKLESIFNFILICNLMLHSLYLASSIATEIYKVFGQSSYTAHVIFASFLLAFKVSTSVEYSRSYLSNHYFSSDLTSPSASAHVVPKGMKSITFAFA